ncbi:MAG: 3-deoxy-7-phosphoheptulonate synthase [Verrucomicrobia bacterium]|nr:3-deoxy-7-phosphoheptulonate synthase [Verrucomicrobiota bacterium]
MHNQKNISSNRMLPSPGMVAAEYPLSRACATGIQEHRRKLCSILDGSEDLLVAILGPCSIHDVEGALQYAEKLKALSQRVSSKIFIIMRVYFEKPRTTLGWKGLIYDPDINGEYQIEKGILVARKLMLQIAQMGLPIATELLDPVSSSFFVEAVTWAGIGARTSESPTHRQLASGLPCPVGFKNSTDGNLQPALDALLSSRACHSFIGVMKNGHIGLFRTKGNPYAHIVLRGGGGKTNYGPEDIALTRERLLKAGLNDSPIIVDCSHGNSKRDYRNQRLAFESILAQRLAGERAVKGLMLESYLKEGKQPLLENRKPEPDISITDACISWEETESLILDAYERL